MALALDACCHAPVSDYLCCGSFVALRESRLEQSECRVAHPADESITRTERYRSCRAELDPSCDGFVPDCEGTAPGYRITAGETSGGDCVVVHFMTVAALEECIATNPSYRSYCERLSQNCREPPARVQLDTDESICIAAIEDPFQTSR